MNINKDLALYWGISAGVFACSSWLVVLSEKRSEKKARRKIKGDAYRKTLSDIEASLDQVSASKAHLERAVRDRLAAFLELYIAEHSSQAEHLEPLLGRLEQLASDEFNYTQRMKLLRKIISELKQPISKFK